MSKNFDVVLQNHDVTVIFLSYSQFEAIWKPYSRPMACKTYVSINSNNFILQKLKTGLKNLIL